MDAGQIQRARYSIEELMDRSHEFHSPREPAAGESNGKAIVGHDIYGTL